MADNGLKLPAWRAILLAALAGVVAGGIAVYVTGGGSGNMEPAAPPQESKSAPPDACAAKAERAKAVADAATGQVAAMLPADPPQSLAMLSFNAPDGEPTTLAAFAGKTVLLNLWATWCAPCRAEMPALDALQKDMGAEDFEVVAVNIDTGDDAKPKKFLVETGVEALGYYRDASTGIFNELKRRALALGLPVTLLVDREGCLLAHMNGPAEWAGDDARRLIEEAISG